MVEPGDQLGLSPVTGVGYCVVRCDMSIRAQDEAVTAWTETGLTCEQLVSSFRLLVKEKERLSRLPLPAKPCYRTQMLADLSANHARTEGVLMALAQLAGVGHLPFLVEEQETKRPSSSLLHSPDAA